MTNEENILKDLNDFLVKKSSQKRRIRVLNFLYSGKGDYPNGNTLSDTTRKNIIKDSQSPLFSEYINKLDLKVEDKDTNNKLKEWIELVNNIKISYKKYLNSVSDVNQFEYLVIAEAPMLTINMCLNCNYIFDDKKNSTFYRSVPYNAFSTEKNKNPTAADLIKIFKEKKVLFIDLISIPLPTIDSKIREKWSKEKNWRVDGNQPLPISLLKISFANAINELKKIKKVDEIKFAKELKVVFMMPPKTSMGIIDYIAKDKQNNKKNLPHELQDLSIVNNLIRTNDFEAKTITKELDKVSLRQFRQIAMNSSNNPCVKHFKHAIK